MAEKSYATQRKVRIIENALGPNWRAENNGSIDAIYNRIVGDDRKNIFCKVRPGVKVKLDEMVQHYDVKVSELIETLIEKEHSALDTMKHQKQQELAGQYSG